MSRLAIVFPGQGSQAVGMLSNLAIQHSRVKEIFEQASKVIDIDLWQLSQQGPENQLNQTALTQPALLAAGYAVWDIFCKRSSLRPEILAGHSLGEYTALVCAGALDFDGAIKLVHQRGVYMQNAVPNHGAMAAILGLSREAVKKICEMAAQDKIVSPANYNSPEQTVIAGEVDAVERAMELAKQEGAKRALPLAVSVPSHCALMKPAAEALAKDLENTVIKLPNIPVLSNVDVKIYESANEIRDGLLRQLYNSVRWVESVEFFANQGIKTIYEFGPGRVLTGLNKRINANLNLQSVSDEETMNAVLSEES